MSAVGVHIHRRELEEHLIPFHHEQVLSAKDVVIGAISRISKTAACRSRPYVHIGAMYASMDLPGGQQRGYLVL